jgi:type IX secretion system PorP/SprF family membrane protein
MKDMKKLLYIICLLALVGEASGQQLPLFSQYVYNKFMINPAHAGSDGYTSFNLTMREQWIGYKGAPRTYSLSWQTRILKRRYKLVGPVLERTNYRPKTDGKVGLGAYVFSDHNGLVQRTGFQASYSYHTWLRDYTQLSLGLALTGYHFIINADESSFYDPNEPWLTDNLRRGVFVPDADFGVYLMSPYFDVGLSAQQLFGSAAKIGESAYLNYKMYRHYYLFGSYTYQVRTRTELQPSVLMKMSDIMRPQADIGLNVIYENTVWTGLTYRTGAGGALVANIRFKFVPSQVMMTSMFFGYSFDFTLNNMSKATYGTHEVVLALKFGDTGKRFRWIDRY